MCIVNRKRLLLFYVVPLLPLGTGPVVVYVPYRGRDGGLYAACAAQAKKRGVSSVAQVQLQKRGVSSVTQVKVREAWIILPVLIEVTT